jgi:hypothetical protein
MCDVASRHYLLGAQISFLIMSFIIGVIAITVQNDIWPFLQKALPMYSELKSWFVLTSIFGVILPAVWLTLDWKNKVIRYSLISLLMMLSLQGLTEIIVTHYFFISMIVPTAILYVGYRIIQLIHLQQVLYRTSFSDNKAKTFRTAIVVSSLLFWSILWIKLTFFVFPQIIYQVI